jgi:hypothetical protein
MTSKLHAWYSQKQFENHQKYLYYVTVDNRKCVQVTEVSETKYKHCYDDAQYLGFVFSHGIYRICSEEERKALENKYKDVKT